MTTPTPISAEARGRLRIWKKHAAARYARFWAAYSDRATRHDVVDFVMRSSETGRARGFEKVRRRLHNTAFLEGVRTATDPIAVWSVIKAREAVAVEPDEPGFAQACVTMNYAVAGGPDKGVAEGLWTIEVPDHALGRLLQRAPGLDIDAALRGAHFALLGAVQDSVPLARRDARFMVPAGPGVFMCSALSGPDISTGGQINVHIHAHTWLHSDQLRDDQEAALIVAAGAGQPRLGQSWLLPFPLRRVVRDGARHSILAWPPGMPETLDRTRGSA